jgi:GNAT superfamily N-acetyltransferase
VGAAAEFSIRQAHVVDVPAMAASRSADIEAGPADGRMASYLEGRHHPQQALQPRIAFCAEHDGRMIGYIAGHLTRRHNCDGEVQYLYVTQDFRRRGVASALLQRLAEWLIQQGAVKLCVNANLDSPPAVPFYLSRGATPLNPYWFIWDDARSLAASRR